MICSKETQVITLWKGTGANEGGIVATQVRSLSPTGFTNSLLSFIRSGFSLNWSRALVEIGGLGYQAPGVTCIRRTYVVIFRHWLPHVTGLYTFRCKKN